MVYTNRRRFSVTKSPEIVVTSGLLISPPFFNSVRISSVKGANLHDPAFILARGKSIVSLVVLSLMITTDVACGRTPGRPKLRVA